MKNDQAVTRRITQLASRLDPDILTGLWIVRAASPDYAPAYEQMGIADMLCDDGGSTSQAETPWHAVAGAAPGSCVFSVAQALSAIMPQSPLPDRLLDLSPLSPSGEGALAELVSILSGIPPEAVSLSQLRAYRTAGNSPLPPDDFDIPSSILRLILSTLDIGSQQEIYDPCYGSGSLLSRALGLLPNAKGLRLFGQAQEPASYQTGHVHSYLHGVSMDLGEKSAATLLEDQHPDRKFGCILANPPFNQSGWYDGAPPEYDKRWQYGIPPRSNGNFAWLQHVVSHLSDQGRGAVILPNGTLTTQTQSEREIRIGLLNAGLVEAIIALPAGIFASTKIPCCIWLLAKGRRENASTLFVDAQQLSVGEESSEDILKLAGLILHHRSGVLHGTTGWYAAATPEEIARKDYILSPNFYTQPEEIALEPLRQNLPRLLALIDELDSRLEGSSLSPILEQWKAAHPAKHWEKAPISQLYHISGGIVKKKEAFGHGTPMADVVTVIRNPFLPDTLPGKVDADAAEIRKYRIQAGDILMNRSSENVEELACCCVAAQDQEAVFGGYLKRLRPVDGHCPDHRYMAAFFRSAIYRQEITKVSPVYTTRSNMNMDRLSKVSVFYPDAAMQEKLGDTMLSVFRFRETCFDQELSGLLEQFTDLLIEQFITYPILRMQEMEKHTM